MSCSELACAAVMSTLMHENHHPLNIPGVVGGGGGGGIIRQLMFIACQAAAFWSSSPGRWADRGWVARSIDEPEGEAWQQQQAEQDAEALAASAASLRPRSAGPLHSSRHAAATAVALP